MNIKNILSRIHSLSRKEKAKVPGFADWSLNPRIHPLIMAHGTGGRITDEEGREYVDFLSGWGTNILGHGYPKVAEAIAKQARQFTSLGLSNELSHKLTDMLSEIIPCADVVKFCKNGSDATLGAIRLARAITNRQHVLYHGYHGFHDWYMAGQDCRGVPPSLQPLITMTPSLETNELEAVFRKQSGEVACLIIDPGMPPVLGHDKLQALVDLTHHYGSLLIFDEIGTGFRVAPGGMQELMDVKPDLACFGKTIANGMPLSALVGKKEYMCRIHEVNFGMTYELETVSIAAALATVSEILEKDVCTILWEKGCKLKGEYRRIAKEYGVRTRLIGPDPRAQLQFEEQEGIPERELRWLCIQELVRNGVLTLGTFLLCYSHSDIDIQKTSDALNKTMGVIAKALNKGSVMGFLDQATYNSLQ